MQLFVYIFHALALCAQRSLALYSSSDDILELTPSNFHELVIYDDSVWIVVFCTPSCGPCQRLVPEYKKLAKGSKGFFKVGSVNADEHVSLGRQYGIEGFPTIKIFGANKRSPVHFNGQLTAAEMAESASAEARKKLQAAFGSSCSSTNNDDIELSKDSLNKLLALVGDARQESNQVYNFSKILKNLFEFFGSIFGKVGLLSLPLKFLCQFGYFTSIEGLCKYF